MGCGDLCCCTWAFSSCGKWGLLFIAVPELLSVVASLVVENSSRHTGFSSCGLGALESWPSSSRGTQA